MRLVDVPLASRAILAGVKTAAVITVGNATLGGLIGAGGYGLTILIGLNKFSVPSAAGRRDPGCGAGVAGAGLV